MHFGLWLHPLPCYSDSSNLLPPLGIYMHCSAIIQVLKTPAEHFLFTLRVWFISSSVLMCVDVCETKPYFIYICVCEREREYGMCISVFECLSLGLLSDLDSDVLSFFVSLPPSCYRHFNRLFLSSRRFLTLTITLEYFGPHERPALVCYRLHSACTCREWQFHS